jgi:TonB-linked SusC/RagA family outer membrane protein
MHIGRSLAGLFGAALLVSSALPVAAQAQNAVISGRVTSDFGEPLNGANVFISEMNISVGTNASGSYQLTIPAARISNQTVQLRVRYIGFVPAARPITIAAGEQTVDFQLRADVNRLEAVVTTGVTGATERAKVPFSVARIDTSQMPVPATNPLSQLQGKVAGANIMSNSGIPGGQPAVLLRGPTSINASGRGQEPLYIVDGVILEGGLSDINPNDIESVEVIKGAAASSLYGSRAGSGVIQITTKTGQMANDGARFSVRSEYGLNDIERDFGIARNHTFLLGADGNLFCVGAYSAGSSTTCSRVMDYRAEVARINNSPGDFALPTVAFPVDPGAVTTDQAILKGAFLATAWPGQTHNAVEQLTDPRPTTNNQLDISGRYGRSNFFGSVNHTQQGGAIMGLEGYERVSGRVNVGADLTDQWKISANSYFSRSEQDGLQQEEGGTGFFRLTRTPAIVDITQRDQFGRLYIRTNLGSAGVQNENPLYSFNEEARSDIRYRFLGGATVQYRPLDWFDADANFSIDRLNWNYNQFRDRGYRTTNNNPGTNGGLFFDGVENRQSINGSLQGTVRRQLLSDLASRFNVRFLYEEQTEDFRDVTGGFLRVSQTPTAPNATDDIEIDSGEEMTRQMSVSGGANFDFKDRYILDVLVRRDGNSRFGADNRWQTYGRGSASWLMAREPWFPTDVVSQMTLRASLGQAGNAPRYSAQYETYSIGAGGSLTAQTQGNPDLRPEVITELEVGTDIELLERFLLNATYAVSQAKDQILPVPIYAASGFGSQWQNAGTLENKTLELSLSMPFVRTADLNWSGRVNYTSNEPMIKRLDVLPFNIGTNLQATEQLIRIEEGLRYGTIFGRGFVTSCGQLPTAFQSQCGGATSAFQKNSDGYIVWVGEGNNLGMGITDNLWNAMLPSTSAPWGVGAHWGMPIVIRNDDRTPKQVPLGHALPDYQLSFSQNVSFKRFTAYALLDGAFGQSVWNQGRHWSFLDFLSDDLDQGGESVQSAKPIGYWYRAPSPDASGVGGFYNVLGPNTETVEDASYMKLREVSVGYHLGPIGGQGDWSLSVIGRNLKTWSDYKGFDPEVGAGASGGESGSALINAVDAFTFPNLRSFTFALTTTF